MMHDEMTNNVLIEKKGTDADDNNNGMDNVSKIAKCKNEIKYLKESDSGNGLHHKRKGNGKTAK
jgi:hypothetical protein